MAAKQMFINGELVDSSSGETVEDMNPATGEVIAQTQRATIEDTDRAVAASKAAFENVWMNTTG